MTRKNRSPEETDRRVKIRELLKTSNINSMGYIQSLFKETIAEFIRNILDICYIILPIISIQPFLIQTAPER